MPLVAVGQRRQVPGPDAGRCLSSDELGDKLGYSGATIRSVESGHRVPKPELAKAADGFFGFPKVFELMEERLRDLPFPESYRPFVPYEKTARVLRIFEPALITGLIQTEAYARAVLGKRPHTTEDEIENLLAVRLARQEILTREDPPLVYALVDEAVLNRQVGTADVMHAQLLQLADLAEWPNISIQIVPYTAGGHIGLLGAFTIAEQPDMSVIVFLENAGDGTTAEDTDRVSQIVARFDALRGEALPVGGSRDLIIKVAEERWTS
ncbi:MAG: Scr1 family TA system antitoxin-like transcriptional regulator [Streptosporangiaceae bacterium]